MGQHHQKIKIKKKKPRRGTETALLSSLSVAPISTIQDCEHLEILIHKKGAFLPKDKNPTELLNYNGYLGHFQLFVPRDQQVR